MSKEGILSILLKRLSNAKPYSTFDVGRSIFDVQSFHCSKQAEFHMSTAARMCSYKGL